MNEYLMLMCSDAPDAQAANDEARWGAYINALRQSGCFDGGSSLGHGERVRKAYAPEPADTRWSGFIRIRAPSLEAAKQLLAGNPCYEAGGTVELRELLRD